MQHYLQYLHNHWQGHYYTNCAIFILTTGNENERTIELQVSKQLTSKT